MKKTNKIDPADPIANLKAVLDVVTGILETEKEMMKMIQLIGRQLNNTNEKVNILMRDSLSRGGLKIDESGVIKKI